ncbi:MAG: response regulator [Candidatus Omnitrophica bacterium]|nr:response regulator [Candidatus Omnitrophota bacterium]
MAEIKYDIRKGIDIYRAIYTSRLQSWISEGKIKQGEVLVWRSGLSGWRRPEELDELIPFFEKWEKRQLKKLKRKKQTTQPSAYNGQIKNILIVDDEQDMCSLLQDALSQRDFNVAVANTKKEAINSIRKKAPDLVLLDLKLPDANGIKLLSRIKKIHPKTAVDIISAYGSEESKEEAKERGAHSFIDKPFTEREVLRSIRQLNGGRKH